MKNYEISKLASLYALVAKMESLKAEMASMEAENQGRYLNGESLAHDFLAFDMIMEKFETISRQMLILTQGGPK